MIRIALGITLLAGTALAQTAPPLPTVTNGLPTTTAPAGVPERVRGTVTGLNGAVLSVKNRDDRMVQIALAEPIVVAAVIPAKLSDAKPGAYIGAAATGPRDKLRALEVLIFPEAMRGTGEGHYPWDLVPESTMTNATIESEGNERRDSTKSQLRSSRETSSMNKLKMVGYLFRKTWI